MLLKNKVALVTGGSRGIGRAIALEFAAQGANVAIAYAGNTAAAEETLSALQELGVTARAYPCNVADFTATKALCDAVIADFGGIDILVNNAGIVKDGLILSLKEEDFDNVIAVNLKGAFNLTKHTYQHFMRKRSGRIINISSVIGLIGNAGQANYAAAKAGLLGLTKSTAKELAARGVTCNVIAPGFIDSDMTASLNEKAQAAILAAIPAHRTGSAQEVAHLAAFLASEHAAYITGQAISIDGGMHM